MTVRQLKDWLRTFPDTDPGTGEDREVYVETGPGFTGPVLVGIPMNRSGGTADVGLFWSKEPI